MRVLSECSTYFRMAEFVKFVEEFWCRMLGNPTAIDVMEEQ